MIRVACALSLALAFTSLAMAQDKPKTGFIDRTFKNDDGTTSPYVVFVPRDYDGTKEYPIILFLHGAGETKSTKTGAKMPVEVGIGPAIKKREKDFPFIVIIPQAEAAKSGVVGRWGATAADGKRAIAMLDEVMKDYKVDSKRQYLTGLSMGGFGTWSNAAAHADRWAAVAPICGGGNVKDAAKLKDLPIWCFHGADDNVVRASLSRDMIDAIKKAGGEPKYTEYPGVGHNSWDKAYATDELYTWFLKHTKK
jgi:predicted peptidase